MNILCVTWDGAGNLPPMLGIARRLSADGHRVRVLSHRRSQEWVESTGSRFVPYATTDDFDSTVGFPPEEELRFLWEKVWFSASVAEDVTVQLQHERADAVVVDHMLAGAFCAVERAEVPAVALFHQPWSVYQEGPFADMWRTAALLLAPIRDSLGLRALTEPQALWDKRPVLVASIPELGPPLPVPDHVRHVGQIVEHPPVETASPTSFPSGQEPLVVVAHSTSQMGQAPVLNGVLEGLAGLPIRVLVTTGPAVDPASLEAPPNASVVEYLPHELVLGDAAVVVAHAGHGTTLAALTHGAPMVCLPMGRDQFFLAQRVEELGAGLQLPSGSSPEDVSAAVRTVLDDPRFAVAARRIAVEIATYGGVEAAVRVVTDAAGVPAVASTR